MLTFLATNSVQSRENGSIIPYSGQSYSRLPCCCIGVEAIGIDLFQSMRPHQCLLCLKFVEGKAEKSGITLESNVTTCGDNLLQISMSGQKIT
jgi:hypothetical protein